MAKLESTVQAEIMLAIGARPGVRVFRNTVGEGWSGEVVKHDGDCVLLRRARYVTFGLCPGSADLIGWRERVVTLDMVGETVAQFLAPEVKTLTGPARTKQLLFIEAVRAAGGCAGIVRTPDEALKLIREE